jgi:hypothetical protein
LCAVQLLLRVLLLAVDLCRPACPAALRVSASAAFLRLC